MKKRRPGHVLETKVDQKENRETLGALPLF
jgi:hypothetical protein